MTAGKLACFLALLAGGPALAHVAPSPDVNNRYLKATLLPEGVRFTYTILFGDLPSVAERRRMDADGDGRLAPDEASAFGAHLLAELAPRILVTLDGRPATGWRVSDVGIGQPTTAGGPLAIDLELMAPYPDPTAAEHHLTLDDAVALPSAGESELRIDESPGVRIKESHLAREATGIELRFAFTGNAAAPGDRAIAATFTVDAALAPRRPRALLIALALAAAALVGLLAGWRPKKAN